MKLKNIFTEGQTAFCLKTNFGYGGKSEVFETTIQSVGRKYITDGRGQMFELREDGFMHLKNTITSPVLLFSDKAELYVYQRREEINKSLLRKHISLPDWRRYPLKQLEIIQYLIEHPGFSRKDLEEQALSVTETSEKNDAMLLNLVKINTGTDWTGLSDDILRTWINASTEQERKSIEGMFLIFTGVEFADYIKKCEKKES